MNSVAMSPGSSNPPPRPGRTADAGRRRSRRPCAARRRAGVLERWQRGAGQVQAEEVRGAARPVTVSLGEGAVGRLVQDPGEQSPRPVGRQMLLGGADQQGARAAPGARGVHVHVEGPLAGLRAVLGEAQLGRADDLAVLHGDQLAGVGVGPGQREAVQHGGRAEEHIGQGAVPDPDEALDVGGRLGAQVAHDDGHVSARYGRAAPVCLPFSAPSALPFPGGCGTIGP